MSQEQGSTPESQGVDFPLKDGGGAFMGARRHLSRLPKPSAVTEKVSGPDEEQHEPRGQHGVDLTKARGGNYEPPKPD